MENQRIVADLCAMGSSKSERLSTRCTARIEKLKAIASQRLPCRLMLHEISEASCRILSVPVIQSAPAVHAQVFQLGMLLWHQQRQLISEPNEHLSHLYCSIYYPQQLRFPYLTLFEPVQHDDAAGLGTCGQK